MTGDRVSEYPELDAIEARAEKATNKGGWVRPGKAKRAALYTAVSSDVPRLAKALEAAGPQSRERPMTARPALSQEGMAALDAALEALKSEPGSPAILIALALAVASSVRKADAAKVKALALPEGDCEPWRVRDLIAAAIEQEIE